jgi:triacylglycerol esterase/lipase EstA (alpha/beta hydrolase family)
VSGLWTLALASLAGCYTTAACEALHEAVTSCDLQPAATTCGELALTDQVALLESLRDEECDGLYGEDGAVKADACEAFGWDCPQRLFPESLEMAPRWPLVFVSGIDDAPAFDWNPDLLDELGRSLTVHHVTLPGWASLEERSEALWEGLQEVLGEGEKANLICYAVGGLDCRFLASPGGLFVDDPLTWLEVEDAVASVSTVATPHGGTNLADALLALPDGEWREIVSSGALGGLDTLDADERDEQLQDVLEHLTLDAMRSFNQRVTDADGVHYQSWAGVSYAFDQTITPTEAEISESCVDTDGALNFTRHPDTHDGMTGTLWLLAPFAEVAVDATGNRVTSPSDGMIAVDSARWGSFRGCLPTDHYDVIGRTAHYGVDPVTGFNTVGFYLNVAGVLAWEGL